MRAAIARLAISSGPALAPTGNVGDSDEFSTSLSRMLDMLDRCQIARDTVTLVFDKGSAALANTVELQEARVGWISGLPWNQAPSVGMGALRAPIGMKMSVVSGDEVAVTVE